MAHSAKPHSLQWAIVRNDPKSEICGVFEFIFEIASDHESGAQVVTLIDISFNKKTLV
jgi:hypothetical protein